MKGAYMTAFVGQSFSRNMLNVHVTPLLCALGNFLTHEPVRIRHTYKDNGEMSTQRMFRDVVMMTRQRPA